jgi:hypothetical protein
MRMPSAMLTVVRAGMVGMLAIGLGLSSSAALAMQAQPQAPTPTPGGQGGMIGGVQRPNRPQQPQGQGPGPQRPVRDPRLPPTVGTGTVRGRVVDAVTGTPIARAHVRNQGRGGRDQQTARTDAEGNFALTKLPAGPVYLSVEKATYLAATYPERRRTMRGSNLMIADGQTIDNVTVQMSRGGAIAGRIIDAHGDPVEHVMVNAIPASPPKAGMPGRGMGMRTFQPSNDIGEYRVSRLEPGQYFLLASPQRRSGMAEDAGSASGRTFYPGVPAIEQAQPITIERGQTLAGLDFQLLETTLTKVSGNVLSAKGSPARGGHVSVRVAPPPAGSKGTAELRGMMPEMGGGGGIDQNGAFELMLQPGDYILEAMASQSDEGPRMGRFDMDRGQIRLQVAGEAMAGVTISTGGGGTVSGRFVFNGRSAPPASGFKGFNVAISAQNDTAGDQCRSFSNRPTVNEDGTFTMENIWGSCVIRGGGMMQGWTFEAVMHSGNNITNRPIEFGAGQSISGVEIVLTDRVGDVSVTVSDDRGTPTQDYVTVLFPTEKEKWGDPRFLRAQASSPGPNANALGGFTTGRVMSTSMNNQASFALGSVTGGVTGGVGGSMRNLLAGDYFVIAVEDVAYEDLRDPEFLERLSTDATRVTVSAGGAETVTLRRVKLPEQPE